MAIAPLFNIPTTLDDLNVFSFHNQDMHLQIVKAIGSTGNICLPLYPIDPIPVWDFSGWAIIHQAMHSDFTEVLGIVGNDFTSVDFTNPAQVAAWIRLHAIEHQQAADMLGLS